MELEEVLELCRGFGRVQINAKDYDAYKVVDFAEAVACAQVILQRRQPAPPDHVLPDPKVEYLFDLSGGRGRQSLTAWPRPALTESRSGYAGGLGFSNIDQALEFVAQYPEHLFWLDMESGVRTFE